MTLINFHYRPKIKSHIILSTTYDHKNAIHITQDLLNNHLAMCISLLPEITSLCLWKKKIIPNKETLLLIKSLPANQLYIFKQIKELHPHNAPEFIRLNQSYAEDNYLQWLLNSTLLIN